MGAWDTSRVDDKDGQADNKCNEWTYNFLPHSIIDNSWMVDRYKVSAYSFPRLIFPRRGLISKSWPAAEAGFLGSPFSTRMTPWRHEFRDQRPIVRPWHFYSVSRNSQVPHKGCSRNLASKCVRVCAVFADFSRQQMPPFIRVDDDDERLGSVV